MLVLEGVSLFVNGKLLLNEASLKVNRNNKIGIIGRNGSGKSHLMRLLSGELTPDSGKRILEKNVKVLLVKQELPEGNQSPLEYLRSNDPDIQALEKEIAAASNDDLGDLYDRLAELEEEREKLARSVLMGLGLKEEDLDKPMKNQSGGMQMRISFSKALVYGPDILLLDEPTNYLDLESTQWLIEFLKKYSKAFVLVTHDVRLMNEVTTSTVHLRGGALTEFGGNYQLYREQLEAQAEIDVQKNAVLDKKISRKMSIYYRFRGLPESRAAQAKAQLKQANALKDKKVEIVEDEPVIFFEFPEVTSIPNSLISLEKVTLGYDQVPVLQNLNLTIQHGDKIGLLGRNGQGKSTFIKLLAGKLKAQQGVFHTNPRLKIGYFSQDLTDELDITLTAYQQFKQSTGITNDAQVRSILSEFGFSWDMVNTLVRDLSGGEKSRLLFALICAKSPNLLILDEPTNHLDVETREVLVDAIKDFKGTVILISHDWDLHEKTMKTFLIAHRGEIKPLEKGLAYYQAELQKFIMQKLHASSDKKTNTVVGKKTDAASGAASAKGNVSLTKTKEIFFAGATAPVSNKKQPNQDSKKAVIPAKKSGKR